MFIYIIVFDIHYIYTVCTYMAAFLQIEHSYYGRYVPKYYISLGIKSMHMVSMNQSLLYIYVCSVLHSMPTSGMRNTMFHLEVKNCVLVDSLKRLVCLREC